MIDPQGLESELRRTRARLETAEQDRHNLRRQLAETQQMFHLACRDRKQAETERDEALREVARLETDLADLRDEVADANDRVTYAQQEAAAALPFDSDLGRREKSEAVQAAIVLAHEAAQHQRPLPEPPFAVLTDWHGVTANLMALALWFQRQGSPAPNEPQRGAEQSLSQP
jgi:septal ring factor EnvC (AmiA/AmiB activator)